MALTSFLVTDAFSAKGSRKGESLVSFLGVSRKVAGHVGRVYTTQDCFSVSWEDGTLATTLREAECKKSGHRSCL